MLRRSLRTATAAAAAIVLVLVLGIAPVRAAPVDVKVRARGVLELGVMATDGYLIWAQNSHAHPNHFDLFAKATAGAPIKVNAPGTQGYSNGVDGTTLVYQQWTAHTSVIRFFDLVTHHRSNAPKVVNSPAWEYAPGLDRPWLVVSRWDPMRHTRSLVIYNLVTKKIRILGRVGERNEADLGQVNGNYVVWLTQIRGRTRIEVANLATHTSRLVPNSAGFDWAPSVTPGGTVYFERTGATCGSNPRMLKYPVGGPVSTVFTLPGGVDMSTSSVYRSSDGTIQVFHDRVDCHHLKFGDDLYRFDAEGATLTVAVTGGAGTVTSDPAGIDCGTTCAYTFEPNTTVTLTASGGTFSGWSDPSCVTTDPCTITLSADTSVTATFS